MSDNDVASKNDMKRPQMANPYLQEKPAAEALPYKESPATSNAATTTTPTTGVAKLPAANVETEPNSCTNNNTSIAATAVARELTFGSNEPAVERLPSRSVSFGSAEILTVTELRQHVLSYHNRSVRITGVVLHRLVAAEDGNGVCLVLSDPNHAAQQQRMPPSSVYKKTPGGGGITRKNERGTTVPRFVSRKRSWAAVQKRKTPLESAVTSLTEQQSVLVYAISGQVPINDVAVGDLVMIIGELRSTTTTTVAPIIQAIVEHENNSTTTTTQHFLHARIVRNVNGTDMALHDEALRMRRQHLLQKYPAEESKDPIRQGCGPPPYYDASKTEASV